MLNLQTPATPAAGDRLPGGGTGTPRGAAVVVGAAALAGVLAIVGVRWWTDTGYQPAPAALPDAGPLTSLGLPVTQFVQRIAGIAVVGLLFLRTMMSGRSPAAGAHLAVMTVRWATVWAVGTGAWIAFTLSFLIGVPVTGLPANLDAALVLLGSQQLLAQLAGLWVALLIALFGSRVSGAFGSAALLVVAAAALLPGALTGHAGHHGNPLAAMTALGLHVVTAAVWVGGLLALVVHLRRYPVDLLRVLPGFSTAAGICLVAVGLSGVVESVLMLDGWTALVETDRGRLIIVKTVAIGVLAAVGLWHRRRTMGSAACGRLLPLLRLAGVEIALMAATVGIAVVLSMTG